MKRWKFALYILFAPVDFPLNYILHSVLGVLLYLALASQNPIEPFLALLGLGGFVLLWSIIIFGQDTDYYEKRYGWK